jgi:hypothetical protein
MQIEPVTQKTPSIPSTLISFSSGAQGAYASAKGLDERIARAVARRKGLSMVVTGSGEASASDRG